jgi:hypothetical protein
MFILISLSIFPDVHSEQKQISLYTFECQPITSFSFAFSFITSFFYLSFLPVTTWYYFHLSLCLVVCIEKQIKEDTSVLSTHAQRITNMYM